MTSSKQLFGIMFFGTGSNQFMDNSDKFTFGTSNIKSFESENEARTWLDMWVNKQGFGTYDYYKVIPLISGRIVDPEPTLPSLPPPDFYEVGNPTTASHIIEILGGDLFALSFTPVDNISGAGQMTADLMLDPHDDRVTGRSFKFSFPGWMEQPEIVKLHESATRDQKWKNCRVVHRGNGFAKWFIVILTEERQTK